jgi:enoyl-CoA hydratase/carnithine racemase
VAQRHGQEHGGGICSICSTSWRAIRVYGVVVLTGVGWTFCSGADVGGSATDNGPFLATMRLGGDVALRLHRLPKPTIAKVEGYAVGAGCNMALACDLVVAAEDARFSAIFVQRALSSHFGG